MTCARSLIPYAGLTKSVPLTKECSHSQLFPGSKCFYFKRFSGMQFIYGPAGLAKAFPFKLIVGSKWIISIQNESFRIIWDFFGSFGLRNVSGSRCFGSKILVAVQQIAGPAGLAKHSEPGNNLERGMLPEWRFFWTGIFAAQKTKTSFPDALYSLQAIQAM